jgi:glycosyltransferase involved in cell wall biosynthesis
MNMFVDERVDQLQTANDSARSIHFNMSAHRSHFTLIVPAFNEEEALQPLLRKILDVRAEILEKTGLSKMEVVLVNDGSTDGTKRIAEDHPEVIKIHFEENRGYGAAIKAGFHATSAEFLGFMDADGTCEPRFCTELLTALIQENADMAVGSRMNRSSEMPFMRRLGNLIFARLIGSVSGRPLTDCASGMRVLRRASLRYLHPLPDGLHFTPAMTCLALFNPQLTVIEVPMPYHERIGRSKLSIMRDGVRFLLTILFTAALFNPFKALLSFAALLLLFGVGTCLTAYHWDHSATLWPWVAVFFLVALQSVFVGFLCHHAMNVLFGSRRLKGFGESRFQPQFHIKRLLSLGTWLFAVSVPVFLFHRLFPESLNVLAAIVASVGVLAGGLTLLAGVVLRVIATANERQDAEHNDPYAVN